MRVMNRRLFTIINVLVALITVGAVVFDVTRKKAGPSRPVRQATAARSGSASKTSGEKAGSSQIESVDDLTEARVDDLGSVPAVHLTELMRRMSPEQLAELALKFND